MKRGPKKPTPAAKIARGTWRADRDAAPLLLPGIVAPSDLPQRPSWVTIEGDEIWEAWLGDALAVGMVATFDAITFGNLCNLQGAIASAWRAGEVPPAAHLVEARRLAELFGLAGPQSRVKSPTHGGGRKNIFLTNRRT